MIILSLVGVEKRKWRRVFQTQSRRLKGDFMAITIFLLLNGIGFVFLLYVLANFWMEGHRRQNTTQSSPPSLPQSLPPYLRSSAGDKSVVAPPISHRDFGSVSATPMPSGGHGQRTKQYGQVLGFPTAKVRTIANQNAIRGV
jgi:hypothetical protein